MKIVFNYIKNLIASGQLCSLLQTVELLRMRTRNKSLRDPSNEMLREKFEFYTSVRSIIKKYRRKDELTKDEHRMLMEVIEATDKYTLVLGIHMQNYWIKNVKC